MSNRQNPESTRDKLAQMLDLLGMEARVVVEEEDQETIYLLIHTDDPGRVIGRKGETLHNLQHLLNAMRLNQVADHPRIRINVDSERRESNRRSHLADRG